MANANYDKARRLLWFLFCQLKANLIGSVGRAGSGFLLAVMRCRKPASGRENPKTAEDGRKPDIGRASSAECYDRDGRVTLAEGTL